MIFLSIISFEEAWQNNGLLLATALFVFALALNYTSSSLNRKIAMILFVIAIGVGLAWWTETVWLAITTVVLWFLFPFAEMLWTLRRLRVIRNRRLVNLLTYSSEYDELKELSRNWEEHDFNVMEDAELQPSDPRQVFRFLVSEDFKFLITLGWIKHGPFALTYSAISSWSENGIHWMTWNYPLPYGLKIAPEVNLWRCPSAETCEQLLSQHIEFLKINETTPKSLKELSEQGAAQKMWAEFLDQQVEYNLKQGWLALTKQKDEICYSWRGILGASYQLFRLLVKS